MESSMTSTHTESTASGPRDTVIEPPAAGEGKTVSVADFGARPCEMSDSGRAFAAAIDYCRQNHISCLTVPKGVYRFAEVFDDSPAMLCFREMKNFTFDGGDSEFVFGAVKANVLIAGCDHAVFRNFTIDWDWSLEPLASVARVTSVAADGSSFDLVFPARDDVKADMRIQIATPLNPLTLTPGCPGGVEFRPYRNRFLRQSIYPEINKGAAALVRELSDIIRSIEKIGANRLRVFTVDPAWCASTLRAGMVYLIRHYEYHATGVTLSGTHCALEDIKIYSCPGHGFLIGGGETHHFRLTRCKIMKRPGTTRPISCTADACHMTATRGHFIIEGCDFSGSGDDCLNIHDNSAMGIIRTGANSFISEQGGSFRPGDEVEFRNPDLSPAGFSSRVAQIGKDGQNRMTVTLEDELPEFISLQSVLFNRRYDCSNYIIRDNHFHHNRARGMLIQGSHGLVENNRVEGTMGPAIQIETGAEARWSEGFGVEDVVFRNNWIERCDVNAWMMAVVYMGVYLPWGRTDYPIFHDIVFESNTVVACPRQAFFLSSCKNVTVRGNVIYNPNTVPEAGDVFGSSTHFPPMYGERYFGTIMAAHATDLLIENNTRVETAATLDNGIFADESAARVVCRGNHGFGTNGEEG